MTAAPPPTVRDTFAIALRALWQDARVHVGFASVFVVVSAVTCCCVMGVLVVRLGDAAPGTSPAAMPSLSLQVALRSVTVVFAILAIALHRAFTTQVVLTSLRGGRALGMDAARAAIERWPRQVVLGILRFCAEIVPAVIPFAVLVNSGALRDLWTALGSGADHRLVGPIVVASVAVAYAVWSTAVRPLLGPTPTVMQAEPSSPMTALRRSIALVHGRRAAYFRLRAVFVALTYGLLAATLMPGVVFFGSLQPGEIAGRTNAAIAVVVLGGVLLFYPLAYALFLLETALDAVFYDHLVSQTEPEDVAKVFT